MFVDASAIVAILTREPEADALVDVLGNTVSPITSPIAVFEAILGICRKRRATLAEAREDVHQFLQVVGIQTISVTDKEADTALDAFSRYGKGRGHPAQLNLGDCFAYAMAKNHGVPICSRGMISIRPIYAWRLGHCDPTAILCSLGNSASSLPDPLQQDAHTI